MFTDVCTAPYPSFCGESFAQSDTSCVATIAAKTDAKTASKTSFTWSMVLQTK
jgi:hypothetical protein